MKNTILTILKIFIFLVLSWAIYFLLYGNFHKVDNNIYRSAQLFSFNYPYYIKNNNIKSILNLRDDTNKSWYKTEISISKKHNINHYDYPISATKTLSILEMKNIVNIIKKAKKPLLIHCKAGADRTSLVTALYLYDKGDKNAQNAISLKYGHFPWLGSKTGAMDESFKKFISSF
jgi:protein tyrosine phosphatase (PTP) superfamily phosphohydrolase (DUF442 family)